MTATTRTTRTTTRTVQAIAQLLFHTRQALEASESLTPADAQQEHALDAATLLIEQAEAILSAALPHQARAILARLNSKQ